MVHGIFDSWSRALAQGTAVDGGSSFNQGSSHGSQSTGPLGSHQTGGTGGTAIQHGGRPGIVFSARPIVPVVQQPVLLGGVATGAAGAHLTQGQSTGLLGSHQTGGTSGSSVQLGGRPAVVPVRQPIGGLKRHDS